MTVYNWGQGGKPLRRLERLSRAQYVLNSRLQIIGNEIIV